MMRSNSTPTCDAKPILPAANPASEQSHWGEACSNYQRDCHMLHGWPSTAWYRSTNREGLQQPPQG